MGKKNPQPANTNLSIDFAAYCYIKNVSYITHNNVTAGAHQGVSLIGLDMPFFF